MVAESVSIEIDLDRRSVVDTDGIAPIRMRVGEHALTMVRDLETNQPRDTLFAQPLELARWLASHWWRLRYEPKRANESRSDGWRMRHELSAISGDRIWPPWMIYGTGERVVFEPLVAAVFDRRFAFDQPVPMHAVMVSALDQGVDAFFAAVTAALASNPRIERFSRLVEQLEHERFDEEYAAWRRLEARLGYDPDEAPEVVMERLAQFADEFGEDAVAEAAMASPGANAADALEAVVSAAKHGLQFSLEAARDTTAMAHSLARPTGARAWQRAEEAAARVRAARGIASGPISRKVFAELLSVSWDRVRDAAQGPAVFGGVVEDQNAGRISFQSIPNTKPRRFEMARALGDVAWSPNALFSPLTSVKTERQQFQKAFAQSFLAPIGDVRAFIGSRPLDDAVIGEAAEYFIVGERVIRTLLVNKDVLPRSELARYSFAAPEFEAADFST